MRWSSTAALGTTLLVAPVIAQFGGSIALASVPQCAQNCLASNTGASGGCAVDDYNCFCRSAGFINTVSCCLQNICNATEQKTAITFNVALCSSYNVTVPNYLACSPSNSVSYNTSAVSFPSTVAVTALVSATTIDSYIPAYVTSSNGPIATFDGSPILTGTCTTPVFAIYTDGASDVVQFPYVGCQNQGCCPFNPGNPGPLTVCPHDYFTTSGVCCPSGWTLAATTLGGTLKYCATNPAEIILPASTARSGHAAVVSDMLFTLKYDLGEPQPTGLAAGAIAGIAVGSVAALLILGLACLLCFRAYQRRAQQIRNATMPAPAGSGAEHEEFSPISNKGLEGIPGSAVSSASPATAGWMGNMIEPIVEAPAESEVLRSELPSPESMSTTGYYPLSAPSQPQELYGSTFIHEFHPAFRADGEQAELEGQDTYGSDVVAHANEKRLSEMDSDGLRTLDSRDDRQAEDVPESAQTNRDGSELQTKADSRSRDSGPDYQSHWVSSGLEQRTSLSGDPLAGSSSEEGSSFGTRHQQSVLEARTSLNALNTDGKSASKGDANM